MTWTVGSLFSGCGGLDLACEQLGWEVVWQADNDPAAVACLAAHWPDVPNLGDMRDVDWTTVPPVDVLVGGYPCQPYSSAGLRKGFDDERDGWPWFADAVRVLRPRIVVVENVRNHVRLGFDRTLADLAGLGVDAEWCVVRASDVGAPHGRPRLFAVGWPAADSYGAGSGTQPRSPHGDEVRHEGRAPLQHQQPHGTGEGWDGPDWGVYAAAVRRWEALTGRPAPDPLDDRGRLNLDLPEWMMGLPAGWTDGPWSRAARGRLIGNAVVPLQAQAAIGHLLARAGLPDLEPVSS